MNGKPDGDFSGQHSVNNERFGMPENTSLQDLLHCIVDSEPLGACDICGEPAVWSATIGVGSVAYCAEHQAHRPVVGDKGSSRRR